MITAILLGSLGLLLGMVGLRCTNVGNVDLPRKAKIAAIAGALHILAAPWAPAAVVRKGRLDQASFTSPGTCGMVAISWYANNITSDFFNPQYVGTKYELGPALYLGWSASLLSLLGGICLCSACCCAAKENQPIRIQLPYKASSVVVPPNTSEEGDSSFGKYGKNAYV
ncbi:claudin-15 isoform X1 [Nannospalax galili]|uniref:claudin-15 isoform X1 n=1 Tax=Nannospalax galili TaxID=1026970 RepID=UPI00111BEBD4|nr:claudin-15 isoform X1 [Nannospalax galili]